MLSNVVSKRLLRAFQIAVPFGPVLVIGCPPVISRYLRQLGYEVTGEPLPDNSKQASEEHTRYVAVIIGIFDPTVFDNRGLELLELAALRSTSDIFFLATLIQDVVLQRSQIERHGFSLGLRKHAAYYNIINYVSLEKEDDTLFVPFRWIHEIAQEQYPLISLQQRRSLHMDMTRESGRRSDGHIIRYVCATRYVRPGDHVLDAACGMGYGTWILATTTRAHRVVGLDLDPDAIQYATTSFSEATNRSLEYDVGDVQDLTRYASNSFDLIASFETVEHIGDPECFFREAARILRPGGRIIVSVPNRWVDHTGLDPNPYHLHVYDWARLHREVTSYFIPELAIAQTAGGGFRLSDSKRSLAEMPFTGDIATDSEWCMGIAMKSPIGQDDVPFDDRNYPTVVAPDWQLTRLSSQYRNPWLVPSLLQHGAIRPWRIADMSERVMLARQTCNLYPAGTADHGAALAVIGHAMLESDESDPEKPMAIIDSIDIHLQATQNTKAINIRWKISLLFLKALLLEAFGKLETALEVFIECSKVPPLEYSPAIATKTILSHIHIGKIYLTQSKVHEAREAWLRGVDVCQEVFEKGKWSASVGDKSMPDAVGLFELMDVVSLAQRCAAALDVLADQGNIPATFWHLARQDKDYWIESRDFELMYLKARSEIVK